MGQPPPPPIHWVVNIERGVVEVYTEPAEGKYQSVKVAQRGETLQWQGGLEGSFTVLGRGNTYGRRSIAWCTYHRESHSF